MGITMPLNIAKNLETTANKSLFMDVPKDSTARVRFLPPVDGSEGRVFYLTENHFRLKQEDGEKGMAVACNERHNPDEPCVLCAVARYLENSDDKNEQKLGKGRESIRANRSWYAQVLPFVPGDEGGSYGDVKFMRLPKTGATEFNNILDMQREAGESFVVDPKKGRDVVVKRQDTGVQFTKYSAMAAGTPVSLDKIKPDWESKIFPNADKVWEKLDLRILTADEHKAALVRTYPALDWKSIFKEAGV